MNTPKHFALQLGALITLYVSLTALITLLFGVINVRFPDDIDYTYYYDSAANSIRLSIAMLVVFFPVYLWLTRLLNTIRRREDGVYLTLTKWLIYLSLLVGGAILLGDIVAVLYNFLNGEITTRFILKAAVLGVIVAIAFFYYLKDAQNYWQTRERQSIYFGIGATVLVVAALLIGFMNSETPAEVREMRLDDRQVQDLQNIQWQVESYYQSNEALPTDINQAFSGFGAPTAPKNRSAYRYQEVDGTSYKLCAEFALDTSSNSINRPIYPADKNFNWSHKAGDWCFERSVEIQKLP